MPRGEVEVCLVETSSGLATLAMPQAGGDAPKVGKVLSSKSGSSREVSRQSLVVVRPTAIGFLNQGKQPLSVFLPNAFPDGGPLSTGVTGVVSLEVNCD